ncbi:MAG: hypothetical protein AABW48_04565 [Nanoarchaeota archaeon]
MLEEKVKETKKLGENLLVAEFTNGCAVAYERTSQSSHPVVYGVLHQRKLLSYALPCGWYMEINDNNVRRALCGSADKFTSEVRENLVTYQQQRQTKFGELEHNLDELYKKITAPLEIQENKDRPWGVLISSAVVTLTYPISVPWGLAYLAHQRRANVREFQKVYGEGRVPHSEAMPELLLVAAPSLFANALSETIFSNKQGERFYRVKNKKALITGKNSFAETSKILAAVEFSSLDKEFCTRASWFLGVGHPKDGTPARSHDYPHILFADGKELHQGGFAFERSLDGKYGTHECYAKAQWFLPVNLDAKQQLNSLIEQQRDLIPKESQFEEEIHQNVGEHLAFLKRIGFVGL